MMAALARLCCSTPRWELGTRIEGLRCHSYAGSQFIFIRYGELLAAIGAVLRNETDHPTPGRIQ
jgi:hypothetical protein